jgi:hypothetical protein
LSQSFAATFLAGQNVRHHKCSAVGACNFGFLRANCKHLIGLLHVLLKFDPSRFTPPR